MKTLNLVHQDQSDVKCRIDRYPDGQCNVAILDENLGGNFFDLRMYDERETQIKSRLNNWQDLELIVAATYSLRNLGVENIHLYTPYFIGARSDRQFEEGGNNYLKQVICPTINSLNFKSVTVLDPHSDVLEACLNNFKKIGTTGETMSLVSWATRELYGVVHNGKYPCVLVSPDAGAAKKIYKIAEQIGYKGDIITCSKKRDKKGNLSKIVVPTFVTPAKNDILIIDDICDGGATFINIAKNIKDSWHNSKIYLIVTHGIFSKGFAELTEYFDGIYCTNSYSDHSEEAEDLGIYQLDVF